MSNQIKEIENYLESAYSGAKMIDDVDAMCRIARVLAALKADPEMEIFTEEYVTYDIDCMEVRGRLMLQKGIF